MTRIFGALRDSGNQPFDGTLRVTLDAPLVNTSTTPDTYLLPVPRDYPISAGVIDLELAQSEILGITYKFEVLKTETTVTYFTEAGVEYSGAVHLFSGNYYTGFSHTSSSVLLYRVERESIAEVESFHAMVPNVIEVEFTSLVKTGIGADTLDSSIRRLANLLTRDEQYAAILRGGPYVQGNYNPAIFYRKNDLVQYAGSAWLYINAIPQAGQTPSETNTENWLKFGAKGDPGDGITGQDTPFDPVGWNGAQWVPTANALRDYLVQLAPLFSPVFEGVPTTPTPDTASDDLTIVNSAWVKLLLNMFAANAAFSGNPTAPTQQSSDSSTRLATTAFVKNVTQRYSRIVHRVPAGTNGGTATGGAATTRPLNTIANNAGDILSLSSNQFTLRPGSYRILAIGSYGSGVGANRLQLFSATTSSITLLGLTGVAATGTLNGFFTIATNTVYELRSVVQTTINNTGLGSPLNLAADEIYTTIELWRVD